MAKKRKKTAIIGNGVIGNELYRKLQRQNDVEVVFVRSRKGLVIEKTDLNYFPNRTKTDEKHLETSFDDFAGLDSIFLAISTLDNGWSAYRYIAEAAQRNVKVITCEKGALANFFPELKHFYESRMIACNASVGGGSGILKMVKATYENNLWINYLLGILNGTVNFLLDSWSARDLNYKDSFRMAEALGYCEPNGNQSYVAKLNNEIIEDVTKKTSILVNTCLNPIRPMRASYISKVYPISERNLKNRLLSEKHSRRFMVKLERTERKTRWYEDLIAGFTARHEHWLITAGFFPITKAPYDQMVFPGVNNGIYFKNGESFSGLYPRPAGGPGAGADPTTRAMLDDFRQLVT